MVVVEFFSRSLFPRQRRNAKTDCFLFKNERGIKVKQKKGKISDVGTHFAPVHCDGSAKPCDGLARFV